MSRPDLSNTTIRCRVDLGSLEVKELKNGATSVNIFGLFENHNELTLFKRSVEDLGLNKDDMVVVRKAVYPSKTEGDDRYGIYMSAYHKDPAFTFSDLESQYGKKVRVTLVLNFSEYMGNTFVFFNIRKIEEYDKDKGEFKDPRFPNKKEKRESDEWVELWENA